MNKKIQNIKQSLKKIKLEYVIVIIAMIAVLLIFISNFGVGGVIGNAVSSFLFGVFGLIAYVFPIILIVATFFAISNRGNMFAVVKLVAAILFAVFLCVFLSLISSNFLKYFIYLLLKTEELDIRLTLSLLGV